jgi:hypothetical protein
VSKSGLLFDKGAKRGSRYIDSLGTDYSLRYVPIFITNDRTIPIHLQLAFSKEYDYSVAYGDGKFKVIPLPKEWAMDGALGLKLVINEICTIIPCGRISYPEHLFEI